MPASLGTVKIAPCLGPLHAESGFSGRRPHAETNDSDATLAMRLASGDAAALDVLYQRHYEPALSVALSLLRDRSAAEDLVHEVFLRAWRRASLFRSHRGTFRSWLLTIVRNAAIDHLRQQAMQRKPAVTAAQESLHASAEPDIQAHVILSLEADRLYQALDRLAPEQRVAIQQAFFAELSHREIAQREGLPLGTVKGRVRLGLRRLRTLLENAEQPL